MAKPEGDSRTTRREGDAHADPALEEPRARTSTPDSDDSIHAPTELANDASGTRSKELNLAEVPRERYAVEGEIARGGLGRILRARDLYLGRPVALKELRVRMADSEARFAREMRITAQLQHPSIVPILEAGKWAGGEPFYAMKLVEGRSLGEVIGEARTLAERLALLRTVIDVAEAIAYAHSQRIIHRDLKPANVLVGPFGETVVIDWGLAKDLDEAESPASTVEEPDAHEDDMLDASTFHTHSGAVIGTPAYMPPEQARGEPVDERADVYALGAILYHVLSGRKPYEGTPRNELVHRVGSQPPERLADLSPDVPLDLVAIVERAMERAKEDRYRTAGELVAELSRFTTGQLVGAYRYRVGELFSRYVQKNRAVVSVASAGLVSLAVLGLVSVARISGERDAAHESAVAEARARHQAESRLDDLRLAKAAALLDSDPTGTIAWLKELDTALPGAATVAIDARDRGVARRILRGHTDRVWALAVSPDGRLVATASSDGSAKIRRARDGSDVAELVHGDRVTGVEFSADGALLASGGYDGSVRIFHVDDQHIDTIREGDGPIGAIAISPDGTHVGWLTMNGTVGVVDVANGHARQVGASRLDRTALLLFAPDGRTLVSASHAGTIHVWDLDGGAPRVLEGHGAEVAAIVISPDGATLYSAGHDGTVRAWSLASGQSTVLAQEVTEMTAIALSPDGRSLAAGDLRGTIRVIRLDTREERTLSGHDERITSLAFSPDGGSLASGSWDCTARLWKLASNDVGAFRGHDDVVSDVAFSPDGHTLFSSSWDRTVREYRVRRTRDRVLSGHTVGVHSVDFHPDGRRVASGGHDDAVILWDTETGEHRVLGHHRDHVYRVRFSPDGTWLASSSDDRTVELWPIERARGEGVGGRRPRTLAGHQDDVEEIAFDSLGALARLCRRG